MFFQQGFFFPVLLVLIQKFFIFIHVLVYLIKRKRLFFLHHFLHFSVFHPLLLHSLFFVSLLHLLMQRLSCTRYESQIFTLYLLLVLAFYASHLLFLFDPLQDHIVFLFPGLLFFALSFLHTSNFKLFFFLFFLIDERVVFHLFLLNFLDKLFCLSGLVDLWLSIGRDCTV